jgi:hypothetical protein
MWSPAINIELGNRSITAAVGGPDISDGSNPLNGSLTRARSYGATHEHLLRNEPRPMWSVQV